MIKDKGFTKTFKENRILLFIIMIAVLLSVFYGFRKEGMFLDELYSYGLSNSQYAPFVQDVKGGNFVDTVVTNKELYDYVTVGVNERFNYGSVYYNQSMDVHPPLYYALLHTVCSFFPGVFSKWFGLGLNIAIYAATLFALYKVSELIFKNKKISLTAVLLYGISQAGLSTANMIRMYMLLTFFTVLFAYFLLRLIERERWYYYLGIGATVFAGLFTQYYFVFYAFFACAVLDVYLLAKKEIKKAVIFSVSAILGVAAMYICYPVCVEHLFADKVVSGGSAISNLTDITIYAGRIGHFTLDLVASMAGAVILSVVSVIVILCNKKKTNISCEEQQVRTKTLLLFIPAVFAYVLAAIISPYVIIRYIYNIIPILALLPVYLVYRMLNIKKNDKKCFKNTVVAIVAIAILTLIIQGPTWLYREYIAYDEVMEKQKDKLCVYLTQNADYAVTSDLPQLLNFDEVFITDDVDSFELYQYMEKQDRSKSVVVYIAEGLDLEGRTRHKVLRDFQEKYGYSNYTLIFDDKDFSAIYLVE